MQKESRVERRLDRWLEHAKTPRGAAIIIAAVSTSITVGAGLLMTIVDKDTFPTVGSGLWWAVQTITTVGYGDLVPVSPAGRLLAGLVMLLGIGFLTVITASITSTFVARSRDTAGRAGANPSTAAELRAIDERLERIEAVLAARS